VIFNHPRFPLNESLTKLDNEFNTLGQVELLDGVHTFKILDYSRIKAKEAKRMTSSEKSELLLSQNLTNRLLQIIKK